MWRCKSATYSCQNKFKGEVYHPSDPIREIAKVKSIVITSGGASAVAALEFAAAEEAIKTYILARGYKWIIPRNTVVDVLLSFNIFGCETFLSLIPELLLKKFAYRDLAPTDKGLFTGTPMVNADLIAGQAECLRGNIKGFAENSNVRGGGMPAGGPWRELQIKSDIVVMATGYAHPTLNFPPEDSFGEPYNPPNWYLQTFPPQHVSVCANNCTYVNAIGSVGN